MKANLIPFFTTMTLAIISGTLIPAARMVIPATESGSPNVWPKKQKKEIMKTALYLENSISNELNKNNKHFLNSKNKKIKC